MVAMHITYKHSIIGIIILGVAASFAIVTFSSLYTSHYAAKQTLELPDAYMEEATALIFDKQGKPKMKVVTPRMVHFAKNDVTKLETPQLTLYRKSPQPWYVTSKYAETIKGSEQINFWENVVIQHAADEGSPATIIKTPTLTVTPNTQIAETNDPIEMTQPNIVVKGIGMHADMSNGDIKLLSEARGEYVPNS